MDKKRVVITGLGVVSSIGIGTEEFWNNLIAGKSGISEIETFSTEDFPTHKGGEIKDFRSEKYLDRRKIKYMGRASQFAVVATKQALEDACIDYKDNNRIGVAVGTTLADAQSLEQIDKYWVRKGEDAAWPINVQKYPGYNLANNISFYFGLKGKNMAIPTACAAGNYSIAFSYDQIRQGKIKCMVAGGADPIGRTNFTGFNRLVAVAPEKCQPFDKNRKGMLVGEGAGILVLEDLDHAKRRGARIYAEVLGYALSCDAYNMTIPSADGITDVMEKAIKISGIDKRDIDYTCAHGTGTQANDKAESEAIKRVFGDDYRKVTVSSIKSMLGHTMGAASAIEAITCVLAIKDNIVPPTINFETPDPECDIDCVPNVARKKQVNLALNNSFAFGGNNASVVFSDF